MQKVHRIMQVFKMIRNMVALICFVLTALIILARAATAQTTCAPHAAIVSGLLATYGETVRSLGVTSNGTVVEVFASDETGTWTIVITPPGAPTCMVSAGRGYQSIPASEAL